MCLNRRNQIKCRFRQHRYLELTIFYLATVIEMAGAPLGWNAFCIAAVQAAMAQRRGDMKIYLLIMLIGTLLAAVHFTSTPERRSETLPQ
jgi:hypothetical protein